jgi:hypothetical protein
MYAFHPRGALLVVTVYFSGYCGTTRCLQGKMAKVLVELNFRRLKNTFYVAKRL